jgi:hypothetical protein
LAQLAASKKFESVINQPNIAFVIGNGVNLADSPNSALSWGTLITALTDMRKIKVPKDLDKIFPLTEVADVLRLFDRDRHQLPNDVVELLRGTIAPTPAIAKFAHRNNIPILTTNYDLNLADEDSTSPFKRRTLDSSKVTKTLPAGWNVYRGKPSKELFAKNVAGLWHMHGSIDLKRSLRITSAHYAKAMTDAHDLVHKQRLYAGIDCDPASCRGCRECSWGGQTTWLDIFFHKNLIIIGLGLGTSEIFLRSLLIERTKYLKHHHGSISAVPKSFYVKSGDASLEPGQRFFFENLGFEIIDFDKTESPFDPNLYLSKEGRN